MGKIEFVTNGEFINEILTLKYNSQVIYEGYTDNLVTSITGNLELQLNYNTENTYSVIARKGGNYIIWLPKLPVGSNYKYEPIIFSVNQFVELWSFLGYRAEEELKSVKNINKDELRLVWLMKARGTEQITNLSDLIKSVKNNMIAFSTNLDGEKELLSFLINQWEFENVEIIESKTHWENYIAYLDRGSVEEWTVFKKDKYGNLYINLDNRYTLFPQPISYPK